MELRFSLIIWPDFENVLSDGTEVAITDRYFSAKLESSGYRIARACHHFNGHSFLERMRSSRYCLIVTMDETVEVETEFDVAVASKSFQIESSSVAVDIADEDSFGSTVCCLLTLNCFSSSVLSELLANS